MSHINKIVFLFLILLFLFPSEIFSQKFLALEKRGKVKRLRFYAGDEINIKLYGESFFRNGCIDAFTDTSIFLEGENIPLSGIKAVRVQKTEGGHALLRQMVFYLPAGGAFFLGVTATNSLINDSEPLVPKSMYYTAGSMATAGLLLYPLTFRVYKTKRHPLKIIDTSPL